MQNTEENDNILWWQKIRNDELSTALDIFPTSKNLKILEIGGRDGYQAEIISKNGYNITSIDIDPIYPQFYPVQKGTIDQLKFQENSFDIIYSSNMLQEIQNIEETFKEIKKILKKDGIIIHIVPSSWWSMITNFWHYCFIPKYLIKSNRFQQIFKSNSKKLQIKEDDDNIKSSKKNLKQLFFHPLVLNSIFIQEILYISKFYWKKLFKKNGFNIISGKNCPYFYSAYSIFEFKFLNCRKFLAKIGITSCFCFIMKNE